MLVEEFEEVIEDWYRNHQEEDLTQFLCANHVLKGKDTSESEGGRRQGRSALVIIVCTPPPKGGGQEEDRKEINRGCCHRISALRSWTGQGG